MTAISPNQATASDVQMEIAPRPSRAQRRLDELRRQMQRQLGRKPTSVEKTAMERAALMTLRAEAAMYDANCDPNDLVRLDNAAKRARDAFEKLITPQAKPELSLGDILRGQPA
jgi:hypothetical protein